MIQLIRSAFEEDLPNEDITTNALGLAAQPGTAKLIAKQDLVLSGHELFENCILYKDPKAKISWQFQDAAKILKGQVVALIYGDLLQIIQAERVALNFLGRLSGIATLTRQYVDRIRYSDTKILDTRKTLPGYRVLEKKAVVDGGGHNHRMNLSDAILIKDNHISIAGGIEKAIRLVRSNSTKPIEVETKNLEEVEIACRLEVQRILLDNMSTETMRQALKIIPVAIETEASGNMTLDRLHEVADIGVQFISIGAITHSAPNVDLSLLIER